MYEWLDVASWLTKFTCKRNHFKNVVYALFQMQIVTRALKRPSPDNFLATGGCFEHLSHYGARLAEKRKKKKKMIFDHFWFATSYYTLLLLLQTGAGSI